MKQFNKRTNDFLKKHGIKFDKDIKLYYRNDEMDGFPGSTIVIGENELVGAFVNELRQHKLTVNNEYVAIEYRKVVKDGTMISNLYNSGSFVENLSQALEDIL